MVLLAHPGTQYSHQLARQLARHDSLYQFWTGFAVANDGITGHLSDYLPTRWRRRIANRVIDSVPAGSLRTIPLVEWKARKSIHKGESSQKAFHKRNQSFQEKIPVTSIQKASAVIGFDTSSWLLAERAQEIGKPFFLDQSISHPLTNQAIMEGVAQRFPAWRAEIETRLPEVLECERREHALATKIIVASSFSKQTLVSNGIDEKRIVINPYGVDLDLFHPLDQPRIRKPLRFLFLGMVAARKGVPLLLQAWQELKLPDAELWLVGPVSERERALIPELPGLKVLGKHPHEELPELLRQCDVLVFPSYCEGFAMVLLEALASGLPIITTEATAGPDLITDKVEGRLIPSGEVDALCSAMREFANEPEKIDGMAKAARFCAENFSWDAYGDRWQQILETHG